MRDDLKARVEAQDLEFGNEQEVSKDLEGLVKQQEALRKVIDKMSRHRDQKAQFLKNMESMVSNIPIL